MAPDIALLLATLPLTFAKAVHLSTDYVVSIAVPRDMAYMTNNTLFFQASVDVSVVLHKLHRDALEMWTVGQMSSGTIENDDNADLKAHTASMITGFRKQLGEIVENESFHMTRRNCMSSPDGYSFLDRGLQGWKDLKPLEVLEAAHNQSVSCFQVASTMAQFATHLNTHALHPEWNVLRYLSR